MISLKQLRYFDAVARLKHFGNAANHCAVSQPALSMQIRELENELGLLLLERHPRGIRLTREGREIAERASRILSEVHNLRDYALHGSALLTGSLRLGIIPSIAPYLLPPMLPRLRRSYPQLELNIRETQTEHILSELLEGTLDVLILAMPVEHPEVTTLDLFEDRFRLALPPDRKQPDRVRATPELLTSGRLLLLEEGHCLRDQALAICDLRKADHIDTFGASSLSTLVQMVANGMGMTLLPEISLPLEAGHDQVHLMRFAPPEPKRIVGLAWRASSPRNRDFAEFAKFARNVVPKNRRL